MFGVGWVSRVPGSIYKNLILISQGNSGLSQSEIVILEKERARIVLAPKLYSIHHRLIFLPLFLQLNTFFMHVFQKMEMSINVIKKKIIFFIKGYLYYRNYH